MVCPDVCLSDVFRTDRRSVLKSVRLWSVLMSLCLWSVLMSVSVSGLF
jgi:hypothetical protein